MVSTPLPPADEKAVWVRSMFDRIAPRYDRFNDLLSAGVHRRWRARTIDALAPTGGETFLDLCAGTMDLAVAISERAPGARVAAADFSIRMLASGREKAAATPGPVHPVAADALALPFPDAAFDGCTIGFGLRNLADYSQGLAEMQRVLAPGGRLVVLEFTTPPGKVFRALYHGYFHHVLPRAGALVSHDSAAARYLPESVKAFPDVRSLARLLREAGFDRVRYRYLTGGIAALHHGVRP
ncbi:MAG: bifunctional demethylmenaquinone methyltransferase/2-methoxy-6-polyprenyl-1,4-benzoquinol methylase UbiE [Gemmatimonadetes bacterium]|nr:bifunctional demethylmenaquinone methyltransferase/2-methoxy-6-polyprenyl-1,4-benzoquinol methylase UbiE [Gemmatimonadota bacterium]